VKHTIVPWRLLQTQNHRVFQYVVPVPLKIRELPVPTAINSIDNKAKYHKTEKT
jgi:hypothetical protein